MMQYIFPKFSSGDPEWWISSMENILCNSQIPYEEYVSYGVQNLIGDANMWAGSNTDHISQMDWCAFVYHLIWEFDKERYSKEECKSIEEDSEENVESLSIVDRTEFAALTSVEENEPDKEKAASIIPDRLEDFNLYSWANPSDGKSYLLESHCSGMSLTNRIATIYVPSLFKLQSDCLRYRKKIDVKIISIDVLLEVETEKYKLCFPEKPDLNFQYGQYSYPYHLYDEMLEKEVSFLFWIEGIKIQCYTLNGIKSCALDELVISEVLGSLDTQRSASMKCQLCVHEMSTPCSSEIHVVLLETATHFRFCEIQLNDCGHVSWFTFSRELLTGCIPISRHSDVSWEPGPGPSLSDICKGSCMSIESFRKATTGWGNNVVLWRHSNFRWEHNPFEWEYQYNNRNCSVDSHPYSVRAVSYTLSVTTTEAYQALEALVKNEAVNAPQDGCLSIGSGQSSARNQQFIHMLAFIGGTWHTFSGLGRQSKERHFPFYIVGVALRRSNASHYHLTRDISSCSNHVLHRVSSAFAELQEHIETVTDTYIAAYDLHYPVFDCSKSRVVNKSFAVMGSILSQDCSHLDEEVAATFSLHCPLSTSAITSGVNYAYYKVDVLQLNQCPPSRQINFRLRLQADMVTVFLLIIPDILVEGSINTNLFILVFKERSSGAFGRGKLSNRGSFSCIVYGNRQVQVQDSDKPSSLVSKYSESCENALTFHSDSYHITGNVQQHSVKITHTTEQHYSRIHQPVLEDDHAHTFAFPGISLYRLLGFVFEPRRLFGYTSFKLFDTVLTRNSVSIKMGSAQYSDLHRVLECYLQAGIQPGYKYYYSVLTVQFIESMVFYACGGYIFVISVTSACFSMFSSGAILYFLAKDFQVDIEMTTLSNKLREWRTVTDTLSILLWQFRQQHFNTALMVLHQIEAVVGSVSSVTKFSHSISVYVYHVGVFSSGIAWPIKFLWWEYYGLLFIQVAVQCICRTVSHGTSVKFEVAGAEVQGYWPIFWVLVLMSLRIGFTTLMHVRQQICLYNYVRKCVPLPQVKDRGRIVGTSERSTSQVGDLCAQSSGSNASPISQLVLPRSMVLVGSTFILITGPTLSYFNLVVFIGALVFFLWHIAWSAFSVGKDEVIRVCLGFLYRSYGARVQLVTVISKHEHSGIGEMGSCSFDLVGQGYISALDSHSTKTTAKEPYCWLEGSCKLHFSGDQATRWSTVSFDPGIKLFHFTLKCDYCLRAEKGPRSVEWNVRMHPLSNSGHGVICRLRKSHRTCINMASWVATRFPIMQEVLSYLLVPNSWWCLFGALLGAAFIASSHSYKTCAATMVSLLWRIAWTVGHKHAGSFLTFLEDKVGFSRKGDCHDTPSMTQAQVETVIACYA